jgi:hypothetical protein
MTMGASVGPVFFSTTPSTIRARAEVTRRSHACVSAWGVSGQPFRVLSRAYPQNECSGLQCFRIRLPVAEPIPEGAIGLARAGAGIPYLPAHGATRDD